MEWLIAIPSVLGYLTIGVLVARLVYRVAVRNYLSDHNENEFKDGKAFAWFSVLFWPITVISGIVVSSALWIKVIITRETPEERKHLAYREAVKRAIVLSKRFHADKLCDCDHPGTINCEAVEAAEL